jgi:hypothetical protein
MRLENTIIESLGYEFLKENFPFNNIANHQQTAKSNIAILSELCYRDDTMKFYKVVELKGFIREQTANTIHEEKDYSNLEEPLIPLKKFKSFKAKFKKPIKLNFESVEDNQGFI